MFSLLCSRSYAGAVYTSPVHQQCCSTAHWCSFNVCTYPNPVVVSFVARTCSCRCLQLPVALAQVLPAAVHCVAGPAATWLNIRKETPQAHPTQQQHGGQRQWPQRQPQCHCQREPQASSPAYLHRHKSLRQHVLRPHPAVGAVAAVIRDSGVL